MFNDYKRKNLQIIEFEKQDSNKRRRANLKRLKFRLFGKTNFNLTEDSM